MNIFLQTFSSYVQSSDTLILAVSGGVDSMVLFDLVKKNHPKDKIIVAHFDHSLRGYESDSDRELVANICKNENIVCEIQKMDIAKIAHDERGSLEAVARERRYEFLETMRKKYNASYILTAHHMDDQVETILMGMIKGGKVYGLSGMQVLSGCILRPLLSLKKNDIYSYANNCNIEYHEDSTNADSRYERNRIRNDIVPILFSMQPSIHETISELGTYMQELSGFLSQYVSNWLSVQVGASLRDASFLISAFVGESDFVQREIIVYLYRVAHGGSTQGLSRGAIEECIRFIREASNSHGIKEIKKLRLERRGERVYY